MAFDSTNPPKISDINKQVLDASRAADKNIAETGGIMTPLRLMSDLNKDVFRYGLHKRIDDSRFEDPTYLGFTIEIDETSPLFTNFSNSGGQTFGVLDFLQKYSNRSDMSNRIPIYNEFINKITQIFKSQESISDPNTSSHYVKQHYINSISGLEVLNKKIIKYGEDKLTFELWEDISLWSTYLSQLYNNLTYSYDSGREMIPENLLKFDLNIKISEVRSLTSISKALSNNDSEKAIFTALKNNITSIMYTLHDCSFNFLESLPFDTTINQAGIQGSQINESILKFDLYFRSVSRQLYTPLIKNSILLNDKSSSADDWTEMFTSATRKPSSVLTYNTEIADNEQLKGNSDFNEYQNRLNDMIAYNATFPESNHYSFESKELKFNNNEKSALGKVIGQDNADFLKDPVNKLAEQGKKALDNTKNALQFQAHLLENKLKQKRNELVKDFVNNLMNRVGINPLSQGPLLSTSDNVYYNSGYWQNSLNALKSAVGVPIANQIIKIATRN